MKHTIKATASQHDLLNSLMREASDPYIAGPISSDPETAPARFSGARGFVSAIFGVGSVSPLDLPKLATPEFVCDPMRFVHSRYMRMCYPLVSKAGFIVLLPGWHASAGAVAEARAASVCGLPPLILYCEGPAPSGAYYYSADLAETFRCVAAGDWFDEARYVAEVKTNVQEAEDAASPPCESGLILRDPEEPEIRAALAEDLVMVAEFPHLDAVIDSPNWDGFPEGYCP